MDDRNAAELLVIGPPRAIDDGHPHSTAHEAWLLGSYLHGARGPGEPGLRAYCEWDARMMCEVVEWVMSGGPEPAAAVPRPLALSAGSRPAG